MRHAQLIALLSIACSDAGVTKHNAVPTAEITSHADGAIVREGYPETLRGVVGDPNHDADDLEVAWFLGGTEMCSDSVAEADGSVSCTPDFDPSTHGEVVLEVRDPDGAAADARVTLDIIPTDAPVVTIDPDLGEARIYTDQLVTLRGLVSDTEDDATDLVVAWETDEAGDLGLVVEVSDDGGVEAFAELAPGTWGLKLRATDTTGKSGVDSVAITVFTANEAPDCALVAPTDGAVVPSGETVRLEGVASDSHQHANELSVVFMSDVGGVLGTPVVDSDGSVWMNAGPLTPGEHRITLQVSDELEATCTDSIALTVGTPPTVSITAPSSGAVFDVGSSVVLSATASHIDEAASGLSAALDSDTDGLLWSGNPDGTGAFSLSTTTLTAGAHLITASASNADGMTATASVDLRINALPVVTDVEITPDPAYIDSLLTCAGSATDAEGGSPTLSYAWTDGGSGAALGSTASLDLSTFAMAVGDEVVCTATATDSDGATNTDFARLTLSNRAPNVSVALSPLTGVRTNDTVTATATATDDDGDTVTFSYDWSVDGTVVQSGSASTLDGTTLFDKDDVISVTVTADDGTDSASATSGSVTVENTPPEAPTLSISPSAPEEGDELVCEVDVDSHDDDGDAITYTMSWTVDGVAYTAGGSVDSGLDSGDPGFVGPSTTTWTDDTVDGDDVFEDQTWTCTATPDDGDDDGTDGTVSVAVECYGGQTFSYTGAVQTWTVPDCVSAVTVEAWGAAGGDSAVGVGSGGLGGYATGELTVTPGDTLYIYVGGQGDDHGTGGFNGGGDAGVKDSAGGGGATDIRTSTSLSDRVIVAAGGGGAAYESAWSTGWTVTWGACNGGDGGGTVGLDGGYWQSSCQGGTGGTQTAAGNANGAFGLGGDASTSSDGDMGGGGGGWYGGGAGGYCTGYNGCGAGGSSYVGGVSLGSTTTGAWSGDGAIELSW